MNPVWMLRVNPMERQRVADAQLAALLEEATTLQRCADAQAERAGDDLYRLVPASTGEVRRRLLRLRRDIHNDRGGPVEDLPIELPGTVSEWSTNRARRRDCHNRVRACFDEAVARERSALRGRLGEGNFLTTLAQSAPGVYDAAVRYRRREIADAKDRKAERALLQYLTRAMVRTSPYGRFTAVGLAEPGVAGIPLDGATVATASPEIAIDRPLFDYVMGGVVDGGDPPVALAPTARISDDRVTFFRVGADTVRQLSASMSRQTRVLVDLLALGPCRRSPLADAIAERLGLDRSAAERLVHMALGLGLVVTAWRGDEFVAVPVEEALRELAAAGADQMLEGLRQFQSGLNRLGDPGSGHAGERVVIAGQLELLSAGLSRSARRPAKLTVNEDYVLDPLTVDPSRYGTALGDLAAVTEFLWAFDRLHTVRALLAGIVVDRYGAGCKVPLVEHAEALVRSVYHAERLHAERPQEPVGPADGSLPMLAKIQNEALAALHRPLAGCEDTCLSPGDLIDLVADVPERFRGLPASYGLVVQPLRGDLILNDTYAGHGPMVSRFLHADERHGGDASKRLAARLRELYGAETRVVEDRGTHGVGINAHPPVLDEHLGPEGWWRLQLVHDIESDTVSIVDGDGDPVTVLALGAQLPEIFPYPVRLATWLCSSGRVVLDVAGKLHNRQTGAGTGSGAAPTIAFPRLRVGNVIVSRRRWYPGADFPVRAGGTGGIGNGTGTGGGTGNGGGGTGGGTGSGGDVDYLLALTRWRARHGVPAEVMLKSVFDGPTSWDSLRSADSRERFFDFRRHAKPQYVDLASALMTRILPRLMERRPPGYVEEALPDMAEGGHALEWMIEMARPAGQAHFDWRPRQP